MEESFDTKFVDACIERACERLGKYFPNDAEKLRNGEKTTTKPCGDWWTRSMGDMLGVTERIVYKLRELRHPKKNQWPHPDVEAWHLMIGQVSVEQAELQAWGKKEFIGKKKAVANEKAWMRDHGAPSYLCKEAQIWWRNKDSGGLWTKVRMVPCYLRDAPAEVDRLRVGQDHNEFMIEELAF